MPSTALVTKSSMRTYEIDIGNLHESFVKSCYSINGIPLFFWKG